MSANKESIVEVDNNSMININATTKNENKNRTETKSNNNNHEKSPKTLLLEYLSDNDSSENEIC